MSDSGRIILGLVAGVVFGAATAIALFAAAAYMLDISEADGAFPIGLALYFAPVGAMAGAIVWAIWAKRR